LNVEIRDSKYSDINQLVTTIRDKDKEEVRKLGSTPRQALLTSYRNSYIRRTGLVDGKVAAMWGVAGPLTSIVGSPYLLTGIEFEKVQPLKIVRLYGAEVRQILQLFPSLEVLVDQSYHESINLMKLVGFRIEKTVYVGKENYLFVKMVAGQHE
jgi:hypothetical protein